MRNLFGNRRGAQAVEFALSLPIMMILVSGTVDYGWYFHQRIALSNATAQAARAGAVSEGDQVNTAATVGADIWTATEIGGFPSFNAVISGTAPDQLLTVTSTAEYNCLVCFFAAPVNATMSHTSVEYIQNQ